MKTGLVSITSSLITVFPAFGAWLLMWITDRLYDWGVGLLAIPIRITLFFMQIGFLIFCVVITVYIALTVVKIFKGALHRESLDYESPLSIKGYMMLLLLPVAMWATSAIFAFLNNWLDFNERGLGFVALGYVALIWAFLIGSVAIIGLWLVILPFFLRNRAHLNLQG